MRILLLLFFFALPAYSQWWSVQTSGVDSNLRGVSVKYDQGSEEGQHYIVWGSGSNGVILRSINDGKSWKQLSVPGGGALDFRDIEAFDANTAYVMASGEGARSRIYKTGDGGKTWKLQYTDKRPEFFLDALACESATHCYALSDPVQGKFLVLATEDGEHWRELPRDRMPAALSKEGAFAASGSAMTLCEDGSIYFGTGVGGARIFRSHDHGLSWQVADTPMASGPSSGIFSVACEGRGGPLVAVGGDYQQPGRATATAIYSKDEGRTWSLAEQQPGGYRSAAGSFSYGDFAAVGPNGTDISHDEGVHWKHTDLLNLNAASFEGTQGWAVGAKGTIARFKTHFEYLIRNGPREKPRWGGASSSTRPGRRISAHRIVTRQNLNNAAD